MGVKNSLRNTQLWGLSGKQKQMPWFPKELTISSNCTLVPVQFLFVIAYIAALVVQEPNLKNWILGIKSSQGCLLSLVLKNYIWHSWSSLSSQVQFISLMFSMFAITLTFCQEGPYFQPLWQVSQMEHHSAWDSKRFNPWLILKFGPLYHKPFPLLLSSSRIFICACS